MVRNLLDFELKKTRELLLNLEIEMDWELDPNLDLKLTDKLQMNGRFESEWGLKMASDLKWTKN